LIFLILLGKDRGSNGGGWGPSGQPSRVRQYL
jgi:hypothetical protein